MANSAFDHSPSITVPGSSTNTALVRWSSTGADTFLDSTLVLSTSATPTLGIAADPGLLTFGNATLAITGAITGITSLTVDNININGNTILSTAGTDLFITPLAGQQLILDGTIIIDAGVVTGATSITSTAFVGALTGAVTATQVDITAQGDLRLQDNTGGQYIAFDSPATVSTSYTVTMPAGLPVADKVLKVTSISSNVATMEWGTAGAGGASVIQMNDNINIALGNSSDSILYYSDTDTIWRTQAVGSGQMRWQTTSGTTAYFENYGSQGPDIYLFHSNGSIGAHTVVANTERHGRIRFGASDGTAFHVGAQIVSTASQTWVPAGSNYRGSNMEFYTTSNDTADPALRMTITDDGAVLIGDTANENNTKGLTINLGSSDNHYLTFKGDISSGLDELPSRSDVETDDMVVFEAEANSTAGGLRITTVTDGGSVAFSVHTFSDSNPGATKSNGTGGTMTFVAHKKDSNADTEGTWADNSNIFTIRVEDDTDDAVRFIFDSGGNAYADEGWGTYSDGRLKFDQEVLPYGLNEVMQLQPKLYNRDSGYLLEDGTPVLEGKRRRQIGFVAQEVMAVIPELVKPLDTPQSWYSLDDGKFAALLVSAVQELNNKHEARFNELQAEIDALKA